MLFIFVTMLFADSLYLGSDFSWGSFVRESQSSKNNYCKASPSYIENTVSGSCNQNILNSKEEAAIESFHQSIFNELINSKIYIDSNTLAQRKEVLLKNLNAKPGSRKEDLVHKQLNTLMIMTLKPYLDDLTFELSVKVKNNKNISNDFMVSLENYFSHDNLIFLNNLENYFSYKDYLLALESLLIRDEETLQELTVEEKELNENIVKQIEADKALLETSSGLALYLYKIISQIDANQEHLKNLELKEIKVTSKSIEFPKWWSILSTQNNEMVIPAALFSNNPEVMNALASLIAPNIKKDLLDQNYPEAIIIRDKVILPKYHLPFLTNHNPLLPSVIDPSQKIIVDRIEYEKKLNMVISDFDKLLNQFRINALEIDGFISAGMTLMNGLDGHRKAQQKLLNSMLYLFRNISELGAPKALTKGLGMYLSNAVSLDIGAEKSNQIKGRLLIVGAPIIAGVAVWKLPFIVAAASKYTLSFGVKTATTSVLIGAGFQVGISVIDSYYNSTNRDLFCSIIEGFDKGTKKFIQNISLVDVIIPLALGGVAREMGDYLFYQTVGLVTDYRAEIFAPFMGITPEEYLENEVKFGTIEYALSWAISAAKIVIATRSLYKNGYFSRVPLDSDASFLKNFLTQNGRYISPIAMSVSGAVGSTLQSMETKEDFNWHRVINYSHIGLSSSLFFMGSMKNAANYGVINNDWSIPFAYQMSSTIDLLEATPGVIQYLERTYDEGSKYFFNNTSFNRFKFGGAFLSLATEIYDMNDGKISKWINISKNNIAKSNNNTLDESDNQRIMQAEKLIGKLTDRQKQGILLAHRVGNGEIGRDGVNPAQIDNYQDKHIFAKDRILKEYDITDFKDRRKLMEEGIVGLVLKNITRNLNDKEIAALIEYKLISAQIGKDGINLAIPGNRTLDQIDSIIRSLRNAGFSYSEIESILKYGFDMLSYKNAYIVQTKLDEIKSEQEGQKATEIASTGKIDNGNFEHETNSDVNQTVSNKDDQSQEKVTTTSLIVINIDRVLTDKEINALVSYRIATTKGEFDQKNSLAPSANWSLSDFTSVGFTVNEAKSILIYGIDTLSLNNLNLVLARINDSKLKEDSKKEHTKPINLGNAIVDKLKNHSYRSNRLLGFIFDPYFEFIKRYRVEGIIDDRRWISLAREIDKYDEETKILHALAFDTDFSELYKYKNTDIERYILKDLRFYIIKEIEAKEIDNHSIIIRDGDGEVVNSTKELNDILMYFSLPREISNKFRISMIVLLAKELGILERIENHEELTKRFKESMDEYFLSYTIDPINKETGVTLDGFQDILIDKHKATFYLKRIGVDIELKLGFPTSDITQRGLSLRTANMNQFEQVQFRKLVEMNNVLNSGEILIGAREAARLETNTQMVSFISQHPEKFPSFKEFFEEMRTAKMKGYLKIMDRVLKLEKGDITSPSSVFELLSAYDVMINGDQSKDAPTEVLLRETDDSVGEKVVPIQPPITREEITTHIFKSKTFAEVFQQKTKVAKIIKGLNIEIVFDSFQETDSLDILKGKIHLKSDLINKFANELQLEVTDDFLIALHQVFISQRIVNLADILKETWESLSLTSLDISKLIIIEKFNASSFEEYINSSEDLETVSSKLNQLITEIHSDQNLTLVIDLINFYKSLQAKNYTSVELQQKLQGHISNEDSVLVNVDIENDSSITDKFILEKEVSSALDELNKSLVIRKVPFTLSKNEFEETDSFLVLRSQSDLSAEESAQIVNLVIKNNALGKSINRSKIYNIESERGKPDQLIEKILTNVYKFIISNSYNYSNLLEQLRKASSLEIKSIAAIISKEMESRSTSPFEQYKENLDNLIKYISSIEKGEKKITPDVFWELFTIYKRILLKQNIQREDVASYFPSDMADIIKGDEYVSNPGELLKSLRNQIRLRMARVVNEFYQKLDGLPIDSAFRNRSRNSLKSLLDGIEEGEIGISSDDFFELCYFYIEVKNDLEFNKIIQKFENLINSRSTSVVFEFLEEQTSLNLGDVFETLKQEGKEIPVEYQERFNDPKTVAELITDDSKFESHLRDVVLKYSPIMQRVMQNQYNNSILIESLFPSSNTFVAGVNNNVIWPNAVENDIVSDYDQFDDFTALQLGALKDLIDKSQATPIAEAIYAKYVKMENISKEAEDILEILKDSSLTSRITSLAGKFNWIEAQDMLNKREKQNVALGFFLDKKKDLVKFVYNGLKNTYADSDPSENLLKYMSLIFPELLIQEKLEDSFEILGALADANSDNVSLEEIYSEFEKKALTILESIGLSKDMLEILGFKSYQDFLKASYKVGDFWKDLASSISRGSQNFKRLLVKHRYYGNGNHIEIFLSLFIPINFEGDSEVYYIYQGQDVGFIMRQEVFKFFEESKNNDNVKVFTSTMFNELRVHDVVIYGNNRDYLSQSKHLSSYDFSITTNDNKKKNQPFYEFKTGHKNGGAVRVYFTFEGNLARDGNIKRKFRDQDFKKLYFLGSSEIKTQNKPTLTVIKQMQNRYIDFLRSNGPL